MTRKRRPKVIRDAMKAAGGGAYLAEYRRRAGFDYIVSALEDKSRDFVMRFAAQDSRLYKLAKSIYVKMR